MPTSPSPSRASAAARRRRRRPPPRQPWCCSFGLDPLAAARRSPLPAPPPPPPSAAAKPGLARRIRSPGRVSPIDSDAAAADAELEARLSSVAEAALAPAPERAPGVVRVRLVSGSGKGAVLEVEEVERVRKESAVVAKLVGGGGGEVEVDGEVEVEAFGEVVELMWEDEEAAAVRRISRAGVSRAIGVLEVSFSLMFDRGVTACLKYLEAVPWNESEEERMKSLLARYSFNEAASRNLQARLQPQEPTSSSELAVELIDSVTKGTNNNARRELRTLVNVILSRSPIYIKGDDELDKESIYNICYSCLNCLVELFEEASDLVSGDQTPASVGKGPVERISKQVENLNWLLQILVGRQMAEDFVDLWAEQKELVSMHERASPMVRYELSRISATIFISMGSGKLHCPGDKRFNIFQAWFRPMLVDFGWLRRCPKGLDTRMLEESIGQALLTLTLMQQQVLFMEWFEAFSGQGRECPNLMRAFQVWWRRSFTRTLGNS